MTDRLRDRDSRTILQDIRTRAASSGRSKIDLSLNVMHDLLTALGDPQDKLPAVVHVAGTNGKGSTIAILSAILHAAGARVHCYTSPYMTTLHESIRVAGQDGRPETIAEPALAALLEQVSKATKTIPATPFEAETATAFLAFAANPADVVLLETGLGGRLDATNVVPAPALTIITPIAIDHAEFLGNAIADIAREKAGILKPNVPVIVARQDDDAYGTIERYADHLRAPVHAAGRDWDAYEQHGRLVFQNEQHLRDLQLPALQGRHQIENAGAAIAAALVLDNLLTNVAITDNALETGLASVAWHGRLQRVAPDLCDVSLATGSEIWIDGGHNAAAAKVLASAMADLEEATPLPLYLVVGMLASKDADSFLGPFRGLAKTIAAINLPDTENATAPSLDSSVIAGAAEANAIEARAMSSLKDALDWIAQQNDGPARILICGSLHLAGIVLAGQDLQ